MFWGCISGKYGRGEGVFWEKSWQVYSYKSTSLVYYKRGTIEAESYSRHTISVVFVYLQQHPGLKYQQDGGSGHNALYTKEVFTLNNIFPVYWPPFSPDLSPIEKLWDRMKDILFKIDPEVHRDYRRLRAAIIEAWNSITNAEVRDMIDAMPQRCYDYIVARGGPTKW
jgi:ketohexokinase/beta-glucosidase